MSLTSPDVEDQPEQSDRGASAQPFVWLDPELRKIVVRQVYVARAVLVFVSGMIAALGLAVTATGLIALLGLGRYDLPDLRVTAAWFWLYREHPDVVAWLRLGAIVPTLLLIGLGALVVEASERKVRGFGRWASEADLHRAGLRDRDGLAVGWRGRRPLVFGPHEHTMIYGQTDIARVSIPALYAWAGSLVVMDLGREAWAEVAGRRAALGDTVVLFDPLAVDGRTARYNPLGHIGRTDAQTPEELLKVAHLLFPPTADDAFPMPEVRQAFLAIGLYVAETMSLPLTLGEVFRKIVAGDARDVFGVEIAKRPRGKEPLSALCVQRLQDFCSNSETTLRAVRQVVGQRMALWMSPAADRATAESDFELATINETRTSLFLCAGPGDRDRLAPLHSLVLGQLIAGRAPRRAVGAEPPLLVALGDFSGLPNATAIARSFALAASLGLRYMAVSESPSRLRRDFGGALAAELVANCGLQAILTPTDTAVAESLCRLLGDCVTETLVYTGRAGVDGRRVARSRQAHAMLLPQELATMPRHELILLRTGHPPARGGIARAPKATPPPEVRTYLPAQDRHSTEDESLSSNEVFAPDGPPRQGQLFASIP